VDVSAAYLDVDRELLISRVSYIEDYAGIATDITVCSPEAFDAEPVGNRRRNRKSKKSAKGALDGKAQSL
jgi:prophage tail gpP-like protein